MSDDNFARRAACYAALAGLVCLLSTSQAGACANETANVSWGAGALPAQFEVVQPAELTELLHPPAFDVANWQARAAEYEKRDLAQMSVEDRNDYALCLLFSGRAMEAREIWVRIEQEKPGLYATAANLGTAYEVSGDDENALKWISEGIKRNAVAHRGTEWLHRDILEAKIALRTSPGWLDYNSVSGLQFGSNPKPRMPKVWPTGNRDQPLNLGSVIVGLTYQLNERLKFVRNPDPIVASLLTDLGNALLLAKAPQSAKVAFARAQEYGAHSPLVLARIDYADALEAAQRSRPAKVAIAGGLALLVIVGGGFTYIRRRRMEAAA